MFCNALQHVDRSRCLVKLPRRFEGFKLLRVLQLIDCIISGADIEGLISTSPKLVQPILGNIHVEGDIRICSMALRSLIIFGDFSDFKIDAPHLIGAFIRYCDNKPSPARVGCINIFCRSFGDLLNIQGIGLLGFSIQVATLNFYQGTSF